MPSPLSCDGPLSDRDARNRRALPLRRACCQAALCRPCRPDFHGNDNVRAERLRCHSNLHARCIGRRTVARQANGTLQSSGIKSPDATDCPPPSGIRSHRHHGRRSGRIYATPVNVFRRSDGYVVALTYGAGADWVRNVVTAGVCDLITHGRRMRVVVSHIEHDEQLLLVPTIVRPILRLIHVADFLHLSSPQPGHGTSLP
jgi:hypothetical protein